MKNLALKLLNFQKEVGAVKKDSINPYFKSKYADINTYIEVVKPILSKYGLVLVQPLTNDNGKPALATILVDSESGENITDHIILPENSDPQKMGAIITYFRRYAIQSMLCLEAEDDDGEKAVERNSVQELAKDFGGVVVESDYGNCAKCGAANKWSTKANKPYCGAMCWKA